MANTIEYASILQSELDKAAVEIATSGWMELNDKLIKYNGGADVKIPALDMDGLGNYDRQTGFVDGDVNLTWETKTMTQDRGRRFTIDENDVNETNFVLTAASVMGECQRDILRFQRFGQPRKEGFFLIMQHADVIPIEQNVCHASGSPFLSSVCRR